VDGKERGKVRREVLGQFFGGMWWITAVGDETPTGRKRLIEILVNGKDGCRQANTGQIGMILDTN
jgi:hypothetical protein